jgi:hypothetical protein
LTDVGDRSFTQAERGMHMLLRNAEAICGPGGLVSIVSILQNDYKVLNSIPD